MPFFLVRLASIWLVVLALLFGGASSEGASPDRTPSAFLVGAAFNGEINGVLNRVRSDAPTVVVSSDPAENHFYSSITGLGQDLLVLDAHSSQQRILRLDSDGGFKSVFAMINGTGFLETDSHGSVYYRDYVANKWWRYDQEGALTGSSSNSSSLAGDGGIDADAFGSVYTASRASIGGTDLIEKWSPSGELLGSTAAPTRLHDIAIDEQSGLLYAVGDNTTSGEPSDVFVYDLNGPLARYQRTITVPMSQLRSIDFYEPTGSLFVASLGVAGSTGAYEILPDGSVLQSFQAQGMSQLWDIVALPIPEPASLLLACLAFPLVGLRIRM